MARWDDPLGSLKSFDIGNTHSYPGGTIPSSLAREFDDAYKLVGIGNNAKRLIATETGYHVAYGIREEGHQGVTPTAKAKYIPRLLAEYFNQGVLRTHIYEFICTYEHMNRRGMRSESKYGLVHFDMSPSPAFESLKNYIHILQEPGASFMPQALDMNINPSAKTVHHTLLQKSNGAYFLLLWNDLPVYHVGLKDPKYGQDIANPAASTTVVLPAMPVSEMQVYQPGKSDQPIRSISPQLEFEIQVPDEILIVAFKLPAQVSRSVTPARELTATTTTTTVNLKWQASQNQPDLKGYFVYRMGQCLGFTDQTHWQDQISLPGVGYTYDVQAVDAMGNLAPPVQCVAMTQATFSDIVVTNVSWEPVSPKPGQPVTFKATIKNIGKYQSPAITHGVAFRIDRKMISWFDARKTPMAPGESLDISPNAGPNGTTAWIATPGKHTLTVQADDQDRFREDNEANNTRDGIIEVISDNATSSTPQNDSYSGLPDMIVTELTMTPAQPKSGDQVTFAATIKNIGTGSAINARHAVAFRVDGQMAAWGIVVKTLDPGQSMLLVGTAGPNNKSTWTCDGYAHQILAHTDDVNRIKESNENNNKMTVNLKTSK